MWVRGLFVIAIEKNGKAHNFTQSVFATQAFMSFICRIFFVIYNEKSAQHM